MAAKQRRASVVTLAVALMFSLAQASIASRVNPVLAFQGKGVVAELPNGLLEVVAKLL
nr:hypothetical protein [uncultured Roseateles sp.]